MSDGVSAVHFARGSELDELRGPWSDLAARDANIFGTWEWASVWWRHFGRDRPLLVRELAGSDGRPAAILPLYLWSARPVRVGRFLGHGPADQLGPVGTVADSAVLAAALEDVMIEESLDVLLAELLPGCTELGRRLGSPTSTESSPVVEIAKGWDAYLASRSANFRQQVRNRNRRLMRSYDTRFRFSDGSSRLEDDLALLGALHRARWGTRSAYTQWEQFHRDFAATAADCGWLRMWFLELDGRPAAAWYGFRFAGVESYYQAGRDPAKADDSVGFTLLAHTIREAANDGIREYRLLRGAEPFKLRFAHRDPGLATYVLARGARGRLAQSLGATVLGSSFLRSAVRRLPRSPSSR